LAISITGAILLGAVLARFYNVLILVPAFALIFASVVAKSVFLHLGLLRPALEFSLLVTSLQIGYVAIPISLVVMAPLRRIKGRSRKCSATPAPIIATPQQ
jgi:ABC-type uncharacterized transport system permease subunit